MLILTRKVGEALKLGQEITLRIIEIKGKNVRVGIEAPAELTIYREEVYEKLQAENRLSSGSSMDEFSKLKETLRKK
jgi:carbon storage regulator